MFSVLTLFILGFVLTACSLTDTPSSPTLTTAFTAVPTLTPLPSPTSTSQPSDVAPTSEAPATLSRGLELPPDAQSVILSEPLVTLSSPQMTSVALAIVTAEPTPFILGDIPAMERRLNETPLFSNFDSDDVRRIFAGGRALGNRPNVFTVIGDSNSTNGDFLYPFGLVQANVCSFGEYTHLQTTVDYFRAPVDERGRSSFTHDSVTADRGFNSASVFDPIWTSGYSSCRPGETPLMCEYRSVRPAAAIIMLGGIDMNGTTAEGYAANMSRIVDESIANGVIPVLTTFVVLPERDVYALSLEMNMSLLDIAQQHRIPLINLWRAAQALPDVGIGPDRTHLRARVGSYCDFTGAEMELGGTLRNLLTLQALDLLRTSVYGG